MRLSLLILHILGGTIGLLSGTFAVAMRKGGRLHRTSGNIFTAGMMLLAASGFCLAVMKSQSGNIVGSIAAFYLIGSGWLAGRRSAAPAPIQWLLPLTGLLATTASFAVGWRTLHAPHAAGSGAPAGMSFFFAAVLLGATAGDLRALARAGLSHRQRVTRHLWRMCFGLFIATGSFFLGQQQVFPAALRGSMLLTVPALLPLPLLFYWVLRVRFGRTYQATPPTRNRHPERRDGPAVDLALTSRGQTADPSLRSR